MANALLANDLGDDVVPQRPDGVGGVGQAAASEVNFRVRLHLHEGEHLLVARLVDKAGSKQVIDAQGLAGCGALGVVAASGELRSQFLIVQDQPLAVVSNFQLVARLHIRRGGKAGTWNSPKRQASPPCMLPWAVVPSSGCPTPCLANTRKSLDRC